MPSEPTASIANHSSASSLLSALNSVISIPILPFRQGRLDIDGHLKNTEFLLNRNFLKESRPRVICIAGTSLIDHISFERRLDLFRETGKAMGDRGILVAGIPPNPIDDAIDLVNRLASLPRPPGAYLLMPLAGVKHPDGIASEYLRVAAQTAQSEAHFLYYLRDPLEILSVVRLMKESERFIGVKVGTKQEDVNVLRAQLRPEDGLVIWGIGDRSAEPAQRGTTGHTSGINLLFPRISDEIHEAQRERDFDRATELERKTDALESIRFRDGRMYNYSAVVAAGQLGGFEDIEVGEGAPFNPAVPGEIEKEVEAAIQPLLAYH